MSYITFQEYMDNGGKADESTFNYLVVDAESKLDLFTNNKLTSMTTLPYEVTPLLVRMINILQASDIESNENITSYSNGDESFSFGNSGELSSTTNTDRRLFTLACQFLGKYDLTYRGVNDGKHL